MFFKIVVREQLLLKQSMLAYFRTCNLSMDFTMIIF
jgi:hypothetical protein